MVADTHAQRNAIAAMELPIRQEAARASPGDPAARPPPPQAPADRRPGADPAADSVPGIRDLL